LIDRLPLCEQTAPLRIAYFIHLNAGSESGVFKKIAAQVSEWRQLGHDVLVFPVTRDPAVGAEVIQFGLSEPCDVGVYRPGRLAGVADRFKAFHSVTQKVIQWKPDVIYSRNDIWYSAVSNMGKSARLVIEINNDDIGELRCQSPVHAIYNRLTRDRAFTPASGFVFVCGELAKLPWFSKFGKPHVVLGNGVCLSDISAVPAVPKRDDVRLVFIGQRDMTWHGVDKIAAMARLFPKWWFDLIGVGPEDSNTVLPSNVKAWGPRVYREYLPLLAEADCAIGTLALHRKNMHEASPLKTREYLAHGLPVIIGYKDTDFPQGADFLLELPNTEDNVRSNGERIRAFVELWRGRRVKRQDIYHLDTNEKERVRLRFLSQVIDSQQHFCP
jgi:glycosyltransferase involved in cell wall biosynthesis